MKLKRFAAVFLLVLPGAVASAGDQSAYEAEAVQKAMRMSATQFGRPKIERICMPNIDKSCETSIIYVVKGIKYSVTRFENDLGGKTELCAYEGDDSRTCNEFWEPRFKRIQVRIGAEGWQTFATVRAGMFDGLMPGDETANPTK